MYKLSTTFSQPTFTDQHLPVRVYLKLFHNIFMQFTKKEGFMILKATVNNIKYLF